MFFLFIVVLQYSKSNTANHIIPTADLPPYAGANTDASAADSHVMPCLYQKEKIITTDKSVCQTATISAQPREHLYPSSICNQRQPTNGPSSLYCQVDTARRSVFHLATSRQIGALPQHCSTRRLQFGLIAYENAPFSARSVH
jgi:hypothetical protein